MMTLPSVVVKGKGVGCVFLLLKSVNLQGKGLERDGLGWVGLGVGWAGKRVLILRNNSFIREFKLTCSKCDSFHVNAWTLAALRCGVRELDVCFSAKQEPFKLTHDLFAFQQLVYIRLGKKFLLDVPKSVCLPKLEDLYLDSIEFSDDDSIRRLISSSPVLEELMVVKCGFKNIRVFRVSAPKLKKLIIECSTDEDDDSTTEACEHEIVVDAPLLESLWYSDFVARAYSLKNLQCLLCVLIDVNMRSAEKLDVVMRGFDLLSGVSKSKALTLTVCSLAVSLVNIYFFISRFSLK
ncbi:hypothetical protein L1049_001477 [Liquidambar formosana]|uniref:F-box/LRR-repeat protein 15/At3g58940/PEG3-like LRR domain-containing protein n=1 Tax=Liquidambar formosana TaxID=63359 RepID=A0AAP0R684_LIQFO